MSANHTPGPWAVGALTDCTVTAGRNGLHVAYPATIGMGHAVEANARLIAAAPDLLKALERILYAHDTGNNGASMGEAVLCRHYAEMARAAIAKATKG